jgi:hypothetical protein
LADVLSFVTGETRSLDGKSIQDYAGTVRAMIDNAGVIGWSYGETWRFSRPPLPPKRIVKTALAAQAAI